MERVREHLNQAKYHLFELGIRLGLLVVMFVLILALVPTAIGESLVDLLQRMLSVRTLKYMNRLLRLRQRLQDARERITAAIAICGE